jgi:hypothetical protein
MYADTDLDEYRIHKGEFHFIHIRFEQLISQSSIPCHLLIPIHRHFPIPYPALWNAEVLMMKDSKGRRRASNKNPVPGTETF